MSDEERYADYLEHGMLDDALDDALDDGARGELDELKGLFAKSHTWDQPPPELADAVVALIRAEAGPVEADLVNAVPVKAQSVDTIVPPTVPPTPPVEPAPVEPEHRRSRAWLRPVLAVAAATVLGMALGALLVSGDDDPGGESFALGATDVIAGATASATVAETGSGLSISLSVEGLPPAEPGTFYQAWMRGETGSVPIGTFHARGGDGPIELWSGVDVADYPTMTVTVQQEGAGPESSGVVVLRGDIPPP